MIHWPPFLRFLCVAAAVALNGCDSPPPEPVGSVNAANLPREFSLHKTPRAAPDLLFQDGAGRPVRLSDFRGKVVVLNVWATWCPPCREEMPTLDRLQAELGGPDLEVMALSVDHVGPQVVRDFYRQIGVKHLRLYIDTTPHTMNQLKVLGLPATLLLDRNGRELGRLVGAAEWDSPGMLEFFRGVIEQTAETRTVSGPRLPGAAPPG